jgi:hypothetical protein
VRAAEARQLAVFEIKKDCCPAAERTAKGRYEEATFHSSKNILLIDNTSNQTVTGMIKPVLSTPHL